LYLVLLMQLSMARLQLATLRWWSKPPRRELVLRRQVVRKSFLQRRPLRLRLRGLRHLRGIC